MLTRAEVKDIKRKIDEALNPVAEELGVKIECGRATFSDDTATIKVEVATINKDGSVNTKEAANYDQRRERYRLPPLGSTISISGEAMKVVGFRAMARKNKILVENAQGKRYMTTVQSVGGKDPWEKSF